MPHDQDRRSAAAGASGLSLLNPSASGAVSVRVPDSHSSSRSESGLLQQSEGGLVYESGPAVRKLIETLGLSVRDVGELVGISYQRVQQLAHH